MNYKAIVDEVNRQAYASKALLWFYQNLDENYVAEQTILDQLSPLIKNKRILDIGIGAGRTTAKLLPISRDYVGIDYAPDLVTAARARFPEADIACRDARDLSCFADATFDFVLVSNNGLDYMVHDDRIAVLREIFRVLKESGFFLFSTHNRDCEKFDRLPWAQRPSFDLALFKNCAHALYYLPRHLRLKRHGRHTDEYAVVNDNAHGYSLLTYYIGIRNQIDQLARIGFVDTGAYDSDGIVRGSDTRSPWIHYLTRKESAQN